MFFENIVFWIFVLNFLKQVLVLIFLIFNIVLKFCFRHRIDLTPSSSKTCLFPHLGEHTSLPDPKSEQILKNGKFAKTKKANLQKKIANLQKGVGLGKFGWKISGILTVNLFQWSGLGLFI